MLIPARPTLRVEWLAGLVALYCIALANGPWWAAVTAQRDPADASTWLFVVCCFVALTALSFVLLVMPSTRWTVKPWLTLVVVATSFAVFYMRTYNVLLDPSMLRNVLRTDLRESRELISWSLAWQVTLWAAVPVATIWWVRIARPPLLRSVLLRIGAICMALVIALGALLLISRDFTSLIRNQREVRYLITPGNFIVSLVRTAATDMRTAGVPQRVIGADAHRDAPTTAPMGAPARKPRVFVFVLGETARAANFSLYGYARNTNPELANLDIVAFRSVTACGTSTEVSVPCMFSPWGRTDYDEDLIRQSEGLLNVLAHAGVDVSWLDNQSGCKGVCDGAGIRSRKLDAEFAPDLCRGEDCFDEILVRGLEADLDTVEADTFIVLHMLGNHGPAYFRRYPAAFRRFTPDCQSAELRRCSRDEVVNAFDNALLYTDHVLAEVMRLLARRADRLDTAMLYVSDHGESLGENGFYLHGIPYAIAPDFQTRVPMIWWQSAGFGTATRIHAPCLRARTADALSHDNLFHSMLGLFDVQTTAYRRERDLFAPCRGK
jgi:lipid A ethanolaminephosphotransferase